VLCCSVAIIHADFFARIYKTGRPLLTPEEIQQLPEGWLILNGLHARPVLVCSTPWYKNRRLRRLVARAQAAHSVQPTAAPLPPTVAVPDEPAVLDESA